LMKEVVDLYDSAIKAMQESRIPNTRKPALFITLLGPYFTMMKTWATEILPPTAFPFAEDNTLQSYLQLMGAVLPTCRLDMDQLIPSPGFNVAASVLGSGARFERHLPRNANDF